MRALTVLLASAVLAGSFATTAGAKLTPVEQKWATPMIALWNTQNTLLHVVIQSAGAQNALVYGTTNNKKFTLILNSFVVCGPTIKKAGSPPSPRLKAFTTALTNACTHDTAGANDFAKAVGAIAKGRSAQSQTLLKQGVAEFKLGTTGLTKAYHALIAVGGKNVFKA